ncbi:hypothetical protein GJQ57_03180 [Ralstonia pickettii]|uniref:Lipoprotein n=1 Tax=Ralstonia pickettii TaxID=329 RepID=A0A7X2HJK4_RALPI|nr:hypothetical protein [Ralstonia pickettii]MRS97651.1 hypothetical protein [Ralstonia pickettii]
MSMRWGCLIGSAAVLVALGSCGGGGEGSNAPASQQQGSSAPPPVSTPSQPPKSASTCREVAQYGITFTFDHAYACGTFANGDHWVAPDAAGGVVTITAISPAYTGTRNGFEVNPAHVDRQGFDSRSEGFDPTLVPALPYAAHGGESVVKSISLVDSPAGRTFLDSAAVLTVLDAIPDQGGANLFRPPYFGPDKPLIPLARVHSERLPKLAPVDYAPSLDDIASRFARVQLDHMNDWTGADIHPVQNLPDYGAQVAEDTADAGLRLMLADSLQAKMPALIGYLQYGIDLAAARHGGLQFAANGGHRIGRKVVLAFAAELLDDADIAALVHDAPYNTYQEDGDLHFSPVANQVLWGAPCSTDDYWFNQNTTRGSRDCRDPYDRIDGGQTPGGEYQFCCTTKPLVATALILRLMPHLQCLWNNPDLVAYADRWVNFGAWTQPDPYAPHGNGAPDTDPSDGIGRYPALHGTNRNDGYYSSRFADAMWVAYRPGAASAVCH